MNDVIGDVARSAADRLRPELSRPQLAAEVEAELRSDGARGAPKQYLDPISLGALIVGVATLVWTVYADMKHEADQPSTDVVSRAVRIRLHDSGARDSLSTAERDRMIEVIVEETVKHADAEA